MKDDHLKGKRRPKWLSKKAWAELKALHPYDQDRLAEMLRYHPSRDEIRETAKRLKRHLETSIYRVPREPQN